MRKLFPLALILALGSAVWADSPLQVPFPQQFVSSNIPSPGTSLSTGVSANITSITLGPGDWDVSGLCAEQPNGATTSTAFLCSVSTTSATLNVTPGDASAFAINDGSTGAGGNNIIPTSTGRFVVTTSTTLFLVVQSTFAVNTMSAYGTIRARRFN